jgi:hypothetical protein
MNWHLIVSQAVSYVIAGLAAAGPLGLAAKFYLDRSLKRLEASSAEQLEIVRHAFNKERDSRQAQIDRSTYATQRALEVEFKAIQDMYAGIARLTMAMESSRPFNQILLPSSKEGMIEMRVSHTSALDKASSDLLRFISTTRLFYPSNLFQAAMACLSPVERELVDVYTHKDFDSPEALDRARQNREAFYPLATQAGHLLRGRLEELKRPPE